MSAVGVVIWIGPCADPDAEEKEDCSEAGGDDERRGDGMLDCGDGVYVACRGGDSAVTTAACPFLCVCGGAAVCCGSVSIVFRMA